MTLHKIGLGGGCHWCTEAIFQSLLGVTKVEQGWISAREADTFSEAIIVHYEAEVIPLKVLVEIHLQTHSCTSDHSMRLKYRSAVYVFSKQQKKEVETMLVHLQPAFEKPLITKVLFLKEFKGNAEEYLSYYQRDPNKAFCRNVISPKLRILLANYSSRVDHTKIRLPCGEV
ncbi:peptide-methionine (S)-S-oxide reductase [uncultured Muriicola sp.]|uniref:peptide-methionine (S)-S-oxide reductase n=1 Tax=uncultured Muriicola sp. TaxID=1583102 RepID=UPI0026227E3C|nr:peptide-methionine (S)-S-oxide reductase [uncultured Muriicola sp.]